MMEKISTNSLVEHISLSEYSSFEKLYNEYAKDLLKIAIRKLGDKEIAMDVVQDLFVDLWQRRFQISITTSERNFLVSSLYYKIFQFFRKQGVLQKHIEHFHTLQSSEQPYFDELPWDTVEASYQDIMSSIDRSVDQMPSRMREIFRLKYYKSYSNQEIAQLLGISHQTVRNQLHRSLEYLREELAYKTVHSSFYVMPILSFVLINKLI